MIIYSSLKETTTVAEIKSFVIFILYNNIYYKDFLIFFVGVCVCTSDSPVRRWCVTFIVNPYTSYSPYVVCVCVWVGVLQKGSWLYLISTSCLESQLGLSFHSSFLSFSLVFLPSPLFLSCPLNFFIFVCQINGVMVHSPGSPMVIQIKHKLSFLSFLL